MLVPDTFQIVPVNALSVHVPVPSVRARAVLPVDDNGPTRVTLYPFALNVPIDTFSPTYS